MTTRDLISSVLATGGRPRFLAQALKYWQRQTYRPRELIVVDDTPGAPGAALCSPLSDVRYIHVEPTLLGTKLNIGIAVSKGDVVQKWDDDDIYCPRFLETAMDAIGKCPPGKGFIIWDCYLVYLAWDGALYSTGHGHKAGPSLCFDRALWERAPFRDIPRSVDTWFIKDHDETFNRVCAPEELIIVRHRANTWTAFWDVDVDSYIEEHLPRHPRPFEEFIAPEDIGFYERLRADLAEETRSARPGTSQASMLRRT